MNHNFMLLYLPCSAHPSHPPVALRSPGQRGSKALLPGTVQQAWVLRLLPCASRVSGSHSRNQIPRRLIFKHVRNRVFSAGSALQEILMEPGCSPSGIRNRTNPGSWPQRRRSPPDGWLRGRVLGSEGGGREASLQRVQTHL